MPRRFLIYAADRWPDFAELLSCYVLDRSKNENGIAWRALPEARAARLNWTGARAPLNDRTSSACHRQGFPLQRTPLERIVATARSIARRFLCPAPQISGVVSITFLMLLGFSAVPQEPARKAADTEAAQLTFNNACRTCHTTKEGDNRLGPNLHNIIGRKAGSLPNYGYSSAMKGADFVWDKEKLDRFIAKPDEIVPGNNMKPYGGLTSAEDRAKVIVFLESPTTN